LEREILEAARRIIVYRDGGVTGDSDLAQDGAQGGTMLKTVSRAGDLLEEGEDPNVAQAVRET
jgi:hypothetical protein